MADIFFFLKRKGFCVSIFTGNGRRAAAADFLLVLFFHIRSRLRRSVKVQGGLFAVPHYQVSRTQQVFHGAAIAAVRDAEGVLEIDGAEGKVEVIHVAAQIEIQTERNTGQGREGFLPFVDGYLNEVAFIFRFVNSDDALIGVRDDFFCHKGLFLHFIFFVRKNTLPPVSGDNGK